MALNNDVLAELLQPILVKFLRGDKTLEGSSELDDAEDDAQEQSKDISEELARVLNTYIIRYLEVSDLDSDD